MQKIILLIMFITMCVKADALQVIKPDTLNKTESNIITIASLTAKGDLVRLKTALNNGLEAGLTINQIKEILVHTYAYCGFPRSIRALQTFMEVLDGRKLSGIKDNLGLDASPIEKAGTKYARGKEILSELTKTPPTEKLSGYGAFAPTIDTFLKEHLFADLFERDVLSYKQRELVTIAVIATIGEAEPMLQSHFAICLNLGFTKDNLKTFTSLIRNTAGEAREVEANRVLEKITNAH
ncbi:carboxymuconolactone decarboxylase family protein [Pedobacter aquatilis]|uniref:carboxymuconolactone decarboxylase family protein n=1 Tax=Pedobacter aquatilis TaxID=351343 RepID=UPI00292FF970|nr:carboxymuconolactone decarboxylase family protein [Pedobacter aquatilis]